MSKVQAQTKSVRQLLSGVKYGIDFYQREYVWGRRHVEEMLNDFEGRFSNAFVHSHERPAVKLYPHYFLGTIITIVESGMRYIVDGQQRLTTLTLLLIYIHHLRKTNVFVADVAPLIFSSSYGEKSFNIAVLEREPCINALYTTGNFDAADSQDLSVRNLIGRYEEFDGLFPEALKGEALPYFVDWLIECVDLVEIEAQTDDDAFTIFETMNDRGVNLGQADMLKGYLLANINYADPDLMNQRKVTADTDWRERIRQLVDLGAGEEEDFLKTWLRAQYAVTIRDRNKGATNQDFENINKFHRWTRDNLSLIGLNSPQDFYDFITQNMNRFAGHYLKLGRAARELTPGWEAVYFNSYNNFTLQFMLALAPLRLEDDSVTVYKKMRLVVTFSDIYLARRMVNFRWNGWNNLHDRMFNLAKAIRGKDIASLRERLLQDLSIMNDSFDRVLGENYDSFSANSYTGRSIRYLLARITAWVEQQCGKQTSFLTYTQSVSGKPFEIEHILAHNAAWQDEYASEEVFLRARNQFGGLVLLPRGTNQSYSDMPYEDKVQHYVKENLLAASLNPQAYKKNPNFTNFLLRSSLPFVPHEIFGKDALDQRKELYRQICEQIWSPERLQADN